MGFFDRDAHNSFDRMFDLNGDGKLDMKERALQYEYLEHVSEEELEDDGSDELDFDDDFDSDFIDD